MKLCDPVAAGGDHSLYLMIFPLGNRELKPLRSKHPCRLCGNRLGIIIQYNTGEKLFTGIRLHGVAEFRQIHFVDMLFRMRKPMEQLAVIRKKKQSGRIPVETSNRLNSALAKRPREKPHDGRVS